MLCLRDKNVSDLILIENRKFSRKNHPGEIRAILVMSAYPKKDGIYLPKKNHRPRLGGRDVLNFCSIIF